MKVLGQNAKGLWGLLLTVSGVCAIAGVSAPTDAAETLPLGAARALADMHFPRLKRILRRANSGEEQVPAVVVRLVDEVVPAAQADPSLDRVALAAVRAASTDVVWSLEPVPRPPHLATSIPLCDAARLERSGVLLA